MPAATPAISIRAMDKRFGKGPLILQGIDLTVAPGDFVALIGPSGSGKSTLLRLVAGLDSPSRGTVEVSAAKDRRSFVFQAPTLLPWLNARENAALPLHLRLGRGATQTAEVNATLARVDLHAHADKLPRQLSGGQQMRVSLARALVTHPELLLLDEPFGALDELTRNRLNEDLLALREQDRWTALFVTHSVGEAVFLANRLIVLSAHPGSIHREIDIPFAYPRTQSLRRRPEFQTLVADVLAVLQENCPA